MQVQISVSQLTMNLLQSTISLGGFSQPVVAVGKNIRVLHGPALMCCAAPELAAGIAALLNQRFQRPPSG